MNSDFVERFKSQFVESSNFKNTIEAIERGDSVVWDRMVDSSYSLLGGVLAEKTRRTMLVVVPEVGAVETVASNLSFFTDTTILKYPVLANSSLENSDEVLLSDDADFGARIRVLKALDKRLEGDEEGMIVVASLAALLQPIPSREQISDDTIVLQKNVEFSRDKLLLWLAEGGFHSTTAVELPGEFASHGGIVDVFATDWERPVRIDFFGDEIDSIRVFDTRDQRTIEEIARVEISRLQAHGAATGVFTDRLPKDTVVFIHETDSVIHNTQQYVSARMKNATGNVNDRSVADVMNALYSRPTVHAVSIASGTEFASLKIDSDFYSCNRLQGNDIASVERAFKATEADEQIVVVCSQESEVKRLSDIFNSTRPAKEERIFYQIGTLTEGFEWRSEHVVFIESNHLFGRAVARRGRKTDAKKLSRVVDSYLELSPNELVIHVERGLARFIGIESIKRLNQEEDHLKLEFANNTHLFVPVSQISKIQRYVGAGKHVPKLATLNGKAWNNQKREVQQAIWEMAGQMVELQATRELQEGVAFPSDGPWQEDFEALFPYDETVDQLSAIDAIKKDMERTRPMDRLLCGDVGFGKTEVALRAAFKAVEAGYQVAILAPTTVLVEQHYRTFCDRTSMFPVRVASLSRYSTKKEQAATIEKLKSGEVDIVIGTQRVVQKDVGFKNLGLVVIDEEQKFGVKDKERLKEFRNTVDVLTMTATPIPRTLHFSLLGIRDISNLATPPEDRLPVETTVMRFNADIIRHAILRELNRGGQVYFLHNRVYDIADVAAKLHSIVPEARIRIGHAQMPTSELEATMRDFVLKQFDVLVCTTIVESGLDIPNANTMFIDGAANFGLAEMHQLRGRVGREKKQAYCYLMLDANQTLHGDAAKRLRALEEYDKLGSGFQIAMRDLEIRGAGNILGTEQSGHIAMIGYEMYCDFLEGAVRAMKKLPQKLRVDVEIDLPGCASLPDSYISDQRVKIDFYRRFDRVSKIEEAVELRNELMDRFGKLPKEAERLFVAAQIRLAAFEYRIKKVRYSQIDNLPTNSKTVALTFRASDLLFKLQSVLKKRGITMNCVVSDKSFEGYVSLPRDLFDSQGNPKVDELFEFTLGLFDQDERNDDQELAKYRKVPVPSPGQTSTSGTNSKSAPLAAAIRRVKSTK